MSSAGPGRLSRSASKIVANPANGFHLLRIEGYSHTTKTILPGQKLSSQQFNVGGHAWRVDVYPNGRAESNSNAISVYLQLIDHTHCVKQAQYKFSLLDNAGIASYELPVETGSFTSDPSVYRHSNAAAGAAQAEPGPGCGHGEFITKEELERRRADLIRDDSIVIRCDVGVTQIVGSYLAQDDLALEDEYDDEEDSEYSPGYVYASPGRHRRPRRPDDDQYVQWCLKQEPAGGSRGRRRGRY